jgi:hypothetical protein
MVKTRLLLLGSLPVLFSLLFGCGAMTGGPAARPEILVIGEGVPGKYLSLAASPTTLFAVFPDKESTTLKTFLLPLGARLPSAPPATTVLDKIDVAPPLSPAFGEHVLAVTGSRVEVLYTVRHNEDHSVLKLAYRDLDAVQWKLDIIDPPGDPVAILQGDSSPLGLFWASDVLLSRTFPSGNAASIQQAPFRLLGRPSTFSPEGFTAFDGASQRLMALTLGESGAALRSVPGASAIQSSLLDPGGKLAVLTWDAHGRRLLLLEETPGHPGFRRTTVTLCDGTGTVALLPPHRRPGFLFLFDEIRRSGAGLTGHQLSLLFPGPVLGGLVSRYEKSVVLSGPLPIESFTAIEAADALYVLALQGTLKLIRIDLPQ